jgi:serine/threonine-protein kinase PRP4
VPDFRDNLPTTSQSRGSDTTNRPRDRTRLTASRESAATTSGLRATTAQPNQQQDVEMYGALCPRCFRPAKRHNRKFASNDIDWTPAPIEDQVPTEESREEKRRRWAAKRAAAEQTKLSQNLHQQAVLTNAAEVTKSNAMSSAHRTETSTSPVVTSHDGDVDSVPTSPDVMVLDKQHGDSEANSPAADSPAAADYDPMQDMLDDQERAASKNQTAQLSSAAPQGADPKALSILPVEKAVVPRKQKKELDMFASDDEDEDEELVQEERGGNKGTILDERLLDNWTDGNNYYKIINNELVNNGRYRMVRSLGQGVFANVAQAEDQKAETDDPSRKIVAIKIIRKIEFMRKASQKEIDFLRRANDADPHDKWHIIRLLGSFDHKGHLCIVFEHMSKNLRDLLKEETSNRGLTLSAVRIYAKQMFYGLQHLQNCQIIHFDLKPDNVLVSADRKTVKLADFGTAVDKRDILERNEYTVSRFYRAPEIILGWDVSYPVDMWAVACTIFELWTGRILFQGRSNNQMVKAFLDIMGWPSEKLLNKGNQANVFTHFDFNPSLTFFSREVDKQGQVLYAIRYLSLANFYSSLSASLSRRRRSSVTSRSGYMKQLKISHPVVRPLPN